MRADLDFDLRIPRNFKITVDVYDPREHWKNRPVEMLRNPQNTEFCERMGLVDPFTVFKGLQTEFNRIHHRHLEGLDPTRPMERPEVSNIWNNPGEIMIDDNVDPEKNKDEIDLSDDEDDECFKPVETKKEDPESKPEKESDSVNGV